jgi:TrmH family RNA methyltransferase
MITSPRNPKVAAAAKLLKRSSRDSERRFLVEGAQAVREALAYGPPLEVLFHTGVEDPLLTEAASAGIPLEALSPEAMARLTATVTPQGLVGISPFVDVELEDLPSEMSCIAVLCAGRDPGNAGTVLRSADAAGADAVVFAGGSVDPYNPKTVRASAGSLFHVTTVREADATSAVQAMKARGMRVYATAAAGDDDLYSLDLSRSSAFLFGNEAWGLPGELVALADATVRIQMVGRAESLNMASAATLCLFESARQRAARAISIDTVIAGAAHDIRSPLTAARNFATVLLNAGDGIGLEDREAMLRGIIHDSEETDRILTQLIDAALIVGGRLKVERSTSPVGPVVATFAENARWDPDHPRVVWRGADASIRAEASALKLILAAFVETAVWWAREGDIDVLESETADSTIIEVVRGGAIEPEGGLETLFVPRRPGTGSGSKIGMFVARGIAEALGGSASATIDGGKLRLTLDLPR